MIKNVVAILSLAGLLVACGGETNVKPDSNGSTASAANTFEAFADGYASPGDTGDSVVYKFASYSKMMETYHVEARQGRFFKWCSSTSNGYKFSENGDLALRQQLRKLYPGETIKNDFLCGDGKGGFYGFAHFASRDKTAFMKAGALNSKVAIDFWPEDGNPQDFWPDAKPK